MMAATRVRARRSGRKAMAAVRVPDRVQPQFPQLPLLLLAMTRRGSVVLARWLFSPRPHHSKRHLRKMRRVTARLALGGFCDVVCRLGQCLGRLDANATRNTDPAKDVGSHLVAALYQVARYASQVDKALGDRINFLPVPQTCFTQFPI